MDTRIAVTLAEPEADAQQMEELTGRLREELLALDVDDVAPARTQQAPAGTRGLDVAAIGTLVVALKGSVPLVEQVVRTVRAWLDRSPGTRSVELTVGDATLKLSSASPAQQDTLIQEFVRAATRSST